MAKKVFIDTNPLIYLVSGQESYHNKVLKFFSDCIEEDAEFYTSTITDAEFLAKPLADNNIEQIERYKKCLKQLDFLKNFISEQVAVKAAQIRAKYQTIKLADAFLTNDKQLKQVSEARVLYLGDL